VPEHLAADAQKAIVKIKKDRGAAVLTQPEEFALEAIIQLEGRPALLIQKGRFETNQAIQLSKLQADALFKKAKVAFG
jgi:hypothetical protein